MGDTGAENYGVKVTNMSTVSLKRNNRDLGLHKAIYKPKFGEPTVLSDNPWEYVSLWLKQKQKYDAEMYWQQARDFYNAGRSLPLNSSPLLMYYCFLNAVKALLTLRSAQFSDSHGISGRQDGSSVGLSNEIIEIKTKGVLPGLTQYLGEKEDVNIYSLKDLLRNIVCIHRAYCLTFSSETNLFIPLKETMFVRKRNSSEFWLQCEVEEKFSNRNILQTIPERYEIDKGFEGQAVVRMKKRGRWKSGQSKQNFENLKQYNAKCRVDLVYIQGSMRLWYLRRQLASSNNIKRYQLTIIFAAMHRLSEMSRYEPVRLQKYMNSQTNWLLSEFVHNAPSQFIDEIASEITGNEFMPPGVKTGRF